MRDKILFHNLLEIRENINFVKSEYKSDDIKIIAVSKKKPLSDIEILSNLNHKLFGENYAQELKEKYENFNGIKPVFHFLGPLQTNKVSMIIDKVDLIHSIDREKLVKVINQEAKKINKIQNILIQLNLTNEDTKAGISEKDLIPFLKNISIYKNIKVIGLMTMPYSTDNLEEIRPFFAKLRNLRNELLSLGYSEIKELSMGMSDDYKIAIEEGSTMIRVGTSIFGARNY
jgi:hypothetical protein